MITAEPDRSPVEGASVGWLLERAPSVSRLPVAVLSAEEKAAELRRVQARKAMDAAYEAELVMGLAADRPDTDDPPRRVIPVRGGGVRARRCPGRVSSCPVSSRS